MTRSSTPHAPLGKSSSLNPKRSPPSECAIGLMSVSHYDPWYYFLTQQLNVGAVGYYFQQVKVDVADAAVDRTVSEPEIGKSGLVVVADGNVAGPVHHVIVDALIPLERRLRKEVAD
jgi:hypothetical protein